MKKFFSIPTPFVLILSAIAFPFVFYCLNTKNLNHYVYLSSYILSAYSLIVLCVSFPSMYRRSKELINGDELSLIVGIRNFMNKFKYSNLYLNDIEFRATISLFSGFLINTFYAVYRCFTGIYNKSIWFIAIGVYYFIFGIIRYILIKRMRTSNKMEFGMTKELFSIKTYRLCGILMFILNITMAGMIIQMIMENRVIKNYNGEQIYYFALYTFYSVIVSIYNVVKFRKDKNLILSASKNLTFVGALMSMFTLQTAMLLTYDNGQVDIKEMNILTGTIIILFTVLLSTFMIIKARKNMKNLELTFL